MYSQSAGRYNSLCILFIIAVLNHGVLMNVLAFSVSMTYTPPLKSYVGKFHRNKGDQFGSTNDNYSSRGADTIMKSPSPKASSRVRSSTTSKSATSEALSVPRPSSSLRSTFEQRMRNIVLKNGGIKMKSIATAATTTLKRRGTKKTELAIYSEPNVFLIDSLKDYKKIVADEEAKIVVVRFFAPWCKACKAVAPIFYRMSRKFPDTVFVDVPVTEDNSILHQGLGVERIPFCHIYHPTAGLVEELRFTRPKARNVVSIFQTYLQGECTDLDIDLKTSLYSSPFER